MGYGKARAKKYKVRKEEQRCPGSHSSFPRGIQHVPFMCAFPSLVSPPTVFRWGGFSSARHRWIFDFPFFQQRHRVKATWQAKLIFSHPDSQASQPHLWKSAWPHPPPPWTPSRTPYTYWLPSKACIVEGLLCFFSSRTCVILRIPLSCDNYKKIITAIFVSCIRYIKLGI